MGERCRPALALLGIVLLVFSPVRIHGLLCQLPEWQLGRTLDLQASRNGNASLAIVQVQVTTDRDSCTSLCCYSHGGTCTVASFESHPGGNGTCYLYNCSPLSLCLLTSQQGTETFVVTSGPAGQSAVRGDGTQSKARKGVLPNEVEDLPLKHDNTTVKPRKGVLKEHGVNTVKARKGVETGTPLISTEMFSDDPDVTNGSLDYVMGSTSVILNLGSDDTTNISFAGQNESETTIQQRPKVTEYTTNASTTEFTGEEQGNITVVMVLLNSTSPAPMAASSDGVVTTSLTKVLASSSISPSPDLTGKNVRVEAVVSDEKDSFSSPDGGGLSDWEMEHNASSIHLLIGLVLGLLLLLTVLGIVAKRIHDSWQRRHYHRMDFLIDGMYHGDP